MHNYEDADFKTFVRNKIQEISPGHINFFKSKEYNDFFKYITDGHYSGNHFNEKLFNYLNPRTSRNCRVCNNETTFRGHTKGYDIYCSRKCVNLDPATLEKSKRTCLQRYGYESPVKSTIIQDKRKQTCLKKYGVDNPRKSTTVQDKIKETNTIRYGFHSSLLNSDIRQKTISRSIEKYGVEYPAQHPDIKKKSKETCLKKYGVSSVTHIKEVLDLQVMNRKKTMINRYGVEHSHQNKDLYDKVVKSCYKNKKYTFPNGRVVNVQGYEGKVLDDLLKMGLKEQEIIVEPRFMPEIWYYSKDRKHRYYPDIYIPHLNWIIEVKSIYTFNRNREVNLLKRAACLGLGFKFNFIIR